MAGVNDDLDEDDESSYSNTVACTSLGLHQGRYAGVLGRSLKLVDTCTAT